VVYYSGHGVQAGNANFLIPTQVQPKAVTENPLRLLYGLDDLFQRMRQKQAKLQFVILDACRTDLFAQPAATPTGGGSVASGRGNLAKSLQVTAGANNGLASIQDAPPSTLVLYATAAKDITFVGEGRNGPLTEQVLKHMGTYGLQVTDFVKRVINGVQDETPRVYGKRLTPFTYGSFGGSFCFTDCGVPPPPPPL
jgi:uncharacterized caspase-like protein